MLDLAQLESLLSCQSLDQLQAATTAIAQEMGFEHFIYGVRVYTSLTRPYQFIFSGYPREWRQRYNEAGYEGIDPTVIHCIRHREVIPVIWEPGLFRERSAARLGDDAKAFGLASGASLALRGRNGETAMLSLATSRTPEQARADIRAALPGAQLLLCYLHEVIEALVLRRETVPLQSAPLTPREQECLRWAAEGKTSWEIAKILGVSERTVIFHVQNASSKLRVNNRQHAVARAIALGLIAR